MGSLIKKIPLFVIFFSVVGYAVYEYRKGLNEEDSQDRVALLSGELEDVKEIHLSNKSLSLLMAKEKGRWLLKKPLEDFVDSPELSRWFLALKAEKVRLISDGPDIPWEKYYLKNPSRVEVTLSSGSRIRFFVSEKAAFDGKWFIRKGESLFLGESDFGREVNDRTLDSYRSKKLLHSFGHPLTIRFQKQDERSLNFSWKESKWSYTDKTFPLNEDRLNTFWSDLSELKGNEIAGSVTEANLKKFGLSEPFVKIVLNFEKGKKAAVIRFSSVKGEGTVYGLTSNRSYILAISKENFEKILLSIEDIRDHSQPFRYKKEEAFRLQLQGKKFSYIVEKLSSSDGSLNSDKEESKKEKEVKSKWKSIEPENKRVNSEEVTALLNTIYDLKGKKYKKGSVGKVRYFLEIKNKKSEVLFKMELGDSYRENKDEFFWVQTNLSEDKVGVLKESLDFIFKKSPFIEEKKKELKKEESSSKEPSS